MRRFKGRIDRPCPSTVIAERTEGSTNGLATSGEGVAVSDAASRRTRATFYTTGMEHSPTSVTGTGWEPTPWHATQQAAWEALRKSKED
jgi:hypothetical protein